MSYHRLAASPTRLNTRWKLLGVAAEGEVTLLCHPCGAGRGYNSSASSTEATGHLEQHEEVERKDTVIVCPSEWHRILFHLEIHPFVSWSREDTSLMLSAPLTPGLGF